ncbi:hypothetical protein P8452_25312 [Trifolium repens]|nr:hypothetical protein P8452_25312 [Trifolium repens]
MAEIAVSLAINHFIPLLTQGVNFLGGVPNELIDIKHELESIQGFLKEADRRAVAERDNINEGVKIWVKQTREAAFRIEDIIDQYMIYVAQQPRDPGCVALIHKISHMIKTLAPRRRLAYEIQEIKLSVSEIKIRRSRYGFDYVDETSTSSTVSQDAKWHDPRRAALYMEETEVIGFEAPRDKLTDWLVKGREERTVISVVGMGGQGKSILAKKVFDSKEVIGHFEDCRVWIKVSRSYTVKRVLRDMLFKFRYTPLQDIATMDRESLINEVRNYLQQKRYLIVFDDVWNVHFWDDIEFAVIDNKKRSRIFMTTRNMSVVMSCKKSSFVEVHELQPLTEEQSLKLFNKKAFQFEYDGCCPRNLIDISSKIVRKCNGLPLAIVVIDDYRVQSKRLIRQWIAEGFVWKERGKTLEEVAEGYLIELIHRNLVQVSSARIDGKPKSCLVHDQFREMILKKIDDSSFCKHISEDGQSSLSGIIRRLSIVTTSSGLNELMESSHIRSLIVFIDKELHVDFGRRILTKCKLLKVLDFEDAPLFNVPTNLGSLIYLKYLRLRYEELDKLPKSIGMLQNLETLDVKGTNVRVLPKEISKLKKLRHLIGYRISLVRLKNGIGGMTSLQTLCYVDLNVDGVVELIRELGKLKKLKQLGLVEVGRVPGMVLSSSLNEMRHLEKLNIESKLTSNGEVLDLNLISPPPMLQSFRLHARLEKLPDWIPNLQNVVQLKLAFSHLNEDPTESLQNLQNLLSLSIIDYAYEGESLRFQDGGFQKLKELFLAKMRNLNSIVIEKGAMLSLKKLELRSIPQLETVPTGIQNIEKLQVLKLKSHSYFRKVKVLGFKFNDNSYSPKGP